MKKILALFIMLTLSLTSCSSYKQNENKVQKLKTVQYTEEEKKKADDIEYFCNCLDKNHGNLYKNVSKANFDSEKEKLLSEIPRLTDFEFYIKINHLLSLIHDNNARAELSYDMMSKLHKVPLEFQKFDDGYYITGAAEEKYLGCKVKSINGINLDKIAEKFRYFLNYQNKQSFEKKSCAYMNCYEILKYFNIVDDSSAIKILLEKNGVEHQQLFNIITAKELENSVKNINCKKQEYSNVDKQNYSTKIIDKDNYYIRYLRCIEDGDYSVNSFIKQIKKDCSENNFKNIIVDFRFNGFAPNNKVGDSMLFIPVVQCLQDLSKHGRKVYGLIGKNTCGDVMTNIIQLKKYANCTLVGQATYGNVNEFVNEQGVIVLPNSRIYLVYSSKYVENDESYKSDSLYPDVLVKHTYKDMMDGRDKEMELITTKNKIQTIQN